MSDTGCLRIINIRWLFIYSDLKLSGKFVSFFFCCCNGSLAVGTSAMDEEHKYKLLMSVIAFCYFVTRTQLMDKLKI